MKYMIRFSKLGLIRYTSHLDMLRLFQRSFKRAGVPLAYSNGFNPHPRLSFAQPLSLGYESISEYLDFETKNDNFTPDEIQRRLASIMPGGIEILACGLVKPDHKSLASLTAYGSYVTIFQTDQLSKDWSSIAENFLNQQQIMATKRQKQGSDALEFDCKDRIKSFQCKVDNQAIHCDLLIKTGSQNHLSPELLLGSFCRYADIPSQDQAIRILRTELYYYKQGQMRPLSDCQDQ